jgi:membrane-associated protein
LAAWTTAASFATASAADLVWVLSFTTAGYFLGSIPVIKNNIKLVFLLIIVVSVLPIVFEVLKHRAEAKRAKERGEGEE